MSVPVVWFTSNTEFPARCCWDQALITDLVTGRLWPPAAPADGFSDTIGHEGIDGAVVVVPARMEDGNAAAVNEAIRSLRWCLIVLTSDELASFPWRDLDHPRMRVWVQTPRPGVHEGADGFLPVGYRPQTRELLAGQRQGVRLVSWMFAGQMTHQRRQDCVAALRALPAGGDGGLLTETDGFGQGLPYETYLQLLTGARLALCPGGPQTPDTFRVWEALEAGCVPIVDALPGERDETGYWPMLFGQGDLITDWDRTPPWPVVHDWATDLPAIIADLSDLATWTDVAARCSTWWQWQKRDLASRFAMHIEELRS